jgi:membrane protein YdbS with pleckstrin-like domain
MMKPENLPDHPAFFRLSDDDRKRIMAASELWEAPEGARVFHPGDSGEELLLLLEGRLESPGNGVPPTRWLPGEWWGEERLANPHPLASVLPALEPSRWLRWPRQTLISLVSSTSSLRNSLSPLYDNRGRLISGLTRELPAVTGKKTRSKRIRPSARPALIGLISAVIGGIALYFAASVSEKLPELLPLASPAIYTGWLLIFLLKRSMAEYSINADSITSKSFDWSRFAVESRHVPVDRIQGVETEISGLIRRILKTGTVIVKTSALDGELILRDVNNPASLGLEIKKMQKSGSERSTGRDREAMRRTLEESGLGVSVPVMLRGVETGQKSVGQRTDKIKFRKSLAVLVGKLLLPLLVGLIPVLGVDVIAGLLPLPGALIYSLTIIPILWALYRFEDWRNDSYLVSGGYAVDLYRKPLGLKESRRQVELASVQNIRTEQRGLLPFLFRYGDVILVTAGGAADTVFEHVSRPWMVQEALFRYREEDLRRREVAARNQRKDDLTRFAEALDQIHGST